jgi:hypothetical protein
VAAVLEEPISPELVLVSPPELAARARELLGGVQPPWIEGYRVPSRLGGFAFALAALVNCVLPTAILLALR